MVVPENCQQCGVCCYSNLDTYVWVQGEDWARLGPAAEQLAHFIGHRAFMKMEAGHCAALQTRPTADGGWQYFCSVYDQRPEICRVLARGSPECLGELASKAERVLRASGTAPVP